MKKQLVLITCLVLSILLMSGMAQAKKKKSSQSQNNSAYATAKKECLKKSPKLQGKALQACIKSRTE